MYLFVDESECKKSQRYYVGGLLCSDEQVAKTRASLAGIAKSLQFYLGLAPEEIEFHGYEICHGEKQWKPLENDIQFRIDTYLAATKAISAAQATFFIKPVRQNRLTVRGDHEMALLYLLEEVDRFCEAASLPAGSVQIICDKINIQSKLENSYLSARVNTTKGWKPRSLSWFLEKLLFVDSRSHRLIQAVDLLLFAHCRTRFFEHQIADGAVLSRNKKRELKALKRICGSFQAITHSLPIFEPQPFRYL